MKKIVILLSMLFSMSSAFAQHTIEVHKYFGWEAATNNQVNLDVDGCTNKGLQSFRIISEHPATVYLREDPPLISYWEWAIHCDLKDVTNNTTVKSYHLPSGATTINAFNSTVLINDLTTQAAISNGNFELDNNNRLIFYFNDVLVEAGHSYAIHLRIENFNSAFGPGVGGTNQTNSSTGSVLINGTPTYTPSAWLSGTIDPSFSDVSVGTMASTSGHEGYLIGEDGRVYNYVWRDEKWNLWCLDWNFTSAAPGAIGVNPTNGEVYFIGTDGRVYNAKYTNNQWNIYCIDWNFTIAAPGAITVNPNNGEVYVIGTDGRVYNCKWTNQWNVYCIDWNVTNAAPGALDINPNNGEVYFIGTDGRVYNCKWTTQWNIYCIDWNVTNAAPGAITVNPNNGEVYFVGTDNRMYNCKWTTQWDIYCIDWNFTSVATGVLKCQPGNDHVNFIGTDNKVYNAVWWNNSQWYMWCIDNNYEATPGAMGVQRENIGGNLHDMILTRDEYGRLHNHYWITCAYFAKPGKVDRALEDAAKLKYYKTNREMYANTTSVKNTISEYNLSLEVFPNPVVNTAQVNFTLTKMENVSLDVYDVAGAKVKTIYHNTTMNAGHHSYELSKQNLAQGVYYIVLGTANNNKVTKKLIMQ